MLNRFAQFMDGLRRSLDDFIEDSESAVTELVRRVLRRREVSKSLPDAVSEEEHKKAARMLESGREYYNKKRYPKAKKYFQRAVKIDGRYGLGFYYLGLALYKDDQVKAAKRAWQRAIDVEPRSDAANKAREKLGNEKIGINRQVKVAGMDSSADR